MIYFIDLIYKVLHSLQFRKTRTGQEYNIQITVYTIGNIVLFSDHNTA